ncbi:serine/threonine/dual specificity protein kinase, catalytic domain-containing protein [Tanacetum coccineum]
MVLPTDKLCHNYSLADIRLATKNFDDKLVVGRGGFGKVYKGHIKSQESGSTIVAIKRLDSTSHQGAPEFVAEIQMLSRLRHAHLVSLLGCCVVDKEMIIVYEYMSNETVYHHLHNSNIPLSWMQRLRISIGAARGLDYLHTGAGTKHGVIHRDVKSSNILLDEDWEAKISDFGLAKICPINQTSTYINTGIKGTFGYIDPDIFLSGKFTRKTDVFAFGVVLFELLSGRRAVSPDGDENLSLARWAQKCVRKKNLDQLVADEIKGELSPKSMKEFAQIANRCLHSDPYERPTMSEVVVALQLSETLQEKFDNSTQPAGLFGFAWKLTSYFSSPTRANSESSGTSKINSDSSSLPTTEDGGDRSEVIPVNKQTLTQDLKIFSYTDLKHATHDFITGVSSGQNCSLTSFLGWVHEKTYTPSKPGVGLPVVVKEYIQTTEARDGAELLFITRVKIVLEVVRCLVFIQSKQLIIDDWILDTYDIWLDKEFNAKFDYFDAGRLVKRTGLQGQRRRWDVYGLGLLLTEILTGHPVTFKGKMDFMEKKHLSGEVALMTDSKINNLVDQQITLSAPEIERARELLSLIHNCIRLPYTLTYMLYELEQIYSRMTIRLKAYPSLVYGQSTVFSSYLGATTTKSRVKRAASALQAQNQGQSRYKLVEFIPAKSFFQRPEQLANSLKSIQAEGSN